MNNMLRVVGTEHLFYPVLPEMALDMSTQKSLLLFH